MSKGKRALVLAGGGVTGIAWETGFLYGAALAGVDLVSNADLVVGTSAGAAAGAQVTSGVPLAELAEAQRGELVGEIPVPGYDRAMRRARHDAIRAAAPSEVEGARQVAQLALTAETVSEPVRRAVIEARLPVHAWPRQLLRIVAVDCATGEHTVFDRDSGVSLVDAVAASCAVPSTWPAVTINGRRYTDGGVRSAANADLALGYERVVIVVPAAIDGRSRRIFDAQVALFPAPGPFVAYVDEESLAVIGPNSLDPSKRGPVLEAGIRQGREIAPQLAAYWGA